MGRYSHCAGRSAEALVSTLDDMHAAIKAKLPEAEVRVTPGSGGHYTVWVKDVAFAGLNRLASQRLVLGALAPLMAGNNAPVHAIDTLETLSA